MKKLLEVLLLISIICTSVVPIYAYGAEDPCEKGCPLTEKFIIPLNEQQKIVIYSYPCGSRGETYVKDFMVSYSIYNYEENVIKQFTYQGNGNYELSIIPRPTKKVMVDKSSNVAFYNTENTDYEWVKTGGTCDYAPNYKCDLYVKPFNGEKETYETVAWDIVVNMSVDAYAIYLSEQFATLLIPNVEAIVKVILGAV